jgi:hypothetical protein
VLAVHPRGDESRPETGVFSTRSPHRPNPIGLHRVRVLTVDGPRVQVADLPEDRYRLIRYDARGHGDSGATADPADYAYPSLAADQLALADALGLGRRGAGEAVAPQDRCPRTGVLDGQVDPPDLHQ